MPKESPEQQQKIDEAINTKGFMEFMLAHKGWKPDDINDPDLVASRFETFKLKEEVKKDVAKVFAEQIAKDFDLKLDSTDTQSVNTYLEKLAIEDPEKIKHLRDSIDLFRTLPSEIEKLSQQLKDFDPDKSQTRLDTLRDQQGKMENVKLGNRWFGMNRFLSRYSKDSKKQKIVTDTIDMVNEYNGIVRTADGAYITTKKIEDEINTIQANLDINTRLNQLRKKFDNARKGLLGQASGVDDFVKIVKAKMKEKMDEALKKVKDEKVKTGQTVFGGFQTTKSSAQATETGIKPLTDKEFEEYEKQMSDNLASNLGIEVSMAVSDVDVSSQNAFAKLEATIKPYLEIDSLGQKDTDGVKEIIKKSLVDSVQNLDQSNDSNIRRFMVKRILAKNNLN